MKKSYSKEEKREYFRKQMDELKEGIEDKITDFLKNSDELKRFIAFKRKHFKNYSINNTLLIYRQMPKASYVAGFRKWEELGYRVKKGSKSINILIPMIRKDEKEKDRIYGFKKGSVFDISQVEATEEAQELPSIDTSIKATKDTVYSPIRLLESTKEYIEQFCPIITDRELGATLGATDGKQIYLKITNNRVDMTGVLIHEFSHYHNHFGDNRKELTKDQKESEAELTTLIFGSFFDLNIEGAYKYLSMYRKERNLAECFEKAYSTFVGILDGFEGKRGLEWILKGQEL